MLLVAFLDTTIHSPEELEKNGYVMLAAIPSIHEDVLDGTHRELLDAYYDQGRSTIAHEPVQAAEQHGVAGELVGPIAGQLLEAERHLSDGAALARRTGRHYLEVTEVKVG